MWPVAPGSFLCRWLVRRRPNQRLLRPWRIDARPCRCAAGHRHERLCGPAHRRAAHRSPPERHAVHRPAHRPPTHHRAPERDANPRRGAACAPSGVREWRGDDKALLGPASRTAPRVFLKIIARLGKKPPDALLALAFGSGTTVYAMQVDGTSGSEILQAFLEERTGAVPGSSAPPTVSIGGKQVTRLGSLVGTFLYASGETFFYVEAPSEPTVGDVLGQLP